MLRPYIPGYCSFLVLLALWGCGVFFAPACAGSLTDLSDPVNMYNQRQYAAALSKFKELVRKNPKDNKSRYYVALCYQGLNQIRQARAEYLWLYKNGCDARLKYNSWVALSNIDRWSQHRAYDGQGNVFAYRSNAPPVYRPLAVVPPPSASGWASGSA